MIAGTLYGRAAEMALMEGWLRDLKVHGRAVLIRGEAGIGKTAFLEAAAHAARGAAESL